MWHRWCRMSAVIGIGWWIGTPAHPARMGWSPAGVTLQGGLHTCLWSLLNHATWEITPRESGGYIHVLVGSILAKIATFPLTTIWTQRLQKIAVGGIAAIRYSQDATINLNQLGNSCHTVILQTYLTHVTPSFCKHINKSANMCSCLLFPDIVRCACCNDKKKSNYIGFHMINPKKTKKTGWNAREFFVWRFFVVCQHQTIWTPQMN